MAPMRPPHGSRLRCDLWLPLFRRPKAPSPSDLPARPGAGRKTRDGAAGQVGPESATGAQRLLVPGIRRHHLANTLSGGRVLCRQTSGNRWRMLRIHPVVPRRAAGPRCSCTRADVRKARQGNVRQGKKELCLGSVTSGRCTSDGTEGSNGPRPVHSPSYGSGQADVTAYGVPETSDRWDASMLPEAECGIASHP